MPKFPVFIVLGSWSLFCAGLAAEVQKVYGAVVSPILLLCLAAAPWVAAKLVADRQAKWRPALEAQMRRHTELVDALPAHYNWLWIALAALAILASGLIGAFHAGVEYGWWEGLTACTSNIAGGGDPLEAIMNAPLIRCDVAPWTLAGISLAFA